MAVQAARTATGSVIIRIHEARRKGCARMPKTIIALRGVSDVGKTSTIRLAYNDLCEKFRCIDPGRPARKEVRRAILEIDGVMVGFASPGDKPDILQGHLVPLLDAGCAVIVCATHTARSRTVDVVNRLANEHGFDVVWIEKDDGGADHDTANRQKADESIAEVLKAVGRAQLGEAA